ncbi:MAG: ATP-binding protein [Lachnospiraceae bacterium]
MSEDTVIFEAGVSDSENHYTNYIAMTYRSNHLYLTDLPAMTPKMSEISSIVVDSLPMLISIIILFALVVSHLYSRGMVEPILRLVRATSQIRSNGIGKGTVITINTKGKDEIAELAVTLNELYIELDQSYRVLREKNEELKEKSRQEEVFLRASSHQLKTPIAASLLLTDGMIGRVGKYQDTSAYLPEVKKQLLSMKKMIDDILDLSRNIQSLSFEQINLRLYANQLSNRYQYTMQEKMQTLFVTAKEDVFFQTDPTLFMIVMDNLIENGIRSSQAGASIFVTFQEDEITILNTQAHIEEELLEHVFEPFIGENSQEGSHGLGLYIVANYSRILHIKISIENNEDGVLTRLRLKDNDETNS